MYSIRYDYHIEKQKPRKSGADIDEAAIGSRGLGDATRAGGPMRAALPLLLACAALPRHQLASAFDMQPQV